MCVISYLLKLEGIRPYTHKACYKRKKMKPISVPSFLVVVKLLYLTLHLPPLTNSDGLGKVSLGEKIAYVFEI